MIASIRQFAKPPRRAAKREARERELRFCVLTLATGAAEIRYFVNPHDTEGVTLRLTAREGEALAHALAQTGCHFLTRDDAPEVSR